MMKQIMRYWYIWLVIVIVISVYACLFLPFIGSSTSRPALTDVSRITSIHFPTDAKLMHSRLIKHFQGGELLAVIQVDQTDVEGIVQSLPMAQASSEEEKMLEHALSPPPWWDIYDVHDFLALRIAARGDEVKYMLIDKDDPSRAVIYVLWRAT